jgi:hypothetical protein
VATRDPELGFEKQLNSFSRVLVVNPLNTYWSYQLTSELALRSREFTPNVRWLNVGPKTPLEYEINLGDHYSTLRHRKVHRRIAHLLSQSGISTSKNLLKPKHSRFSTQLKSIDELRHIQFNQIPLGRMIFSAIASNLKSTAFELKDVSSQIDFFMSHAHECYSVISKEIEEFKPNLILTTNDRLIGSAMSLAIAKQNRINRSLAYWGHSTDHIEDYAESLYSGNEWESKILEHWKKTRNIEYNQAMAKAQNDLEQLRRGPNADSAKYLSTQIKGTSVDMDSGFCVFYAQSEHEHSGHLITNPLERFASQYEAFNALQKVCKELEMPLFLKFHPRRVDEVNVFDRKRLDWEKLKLNDIVQVIEEESSIDTYELISKAKCNFVWSSSVGLECISRGIAPVILGFPTWLNLEWKIHAWNEESIKQKLLTASTEFDPEKLLPFFYYLNSFGSDCRFSDRRSIWNYKGSMVELQAFTPLGKLLNLFGRFLILIEKVVYGSKKSIFG